MNTIPTSVWHMFIHDTEYAGLDGQYFIERTGRARQRPHSAGVETAKPAAR